MSQLGELDTAPDTIEATLNYVRNNGEKIFTETAAPGGLDVRSGGTPDPHRLAIRNGRPRDFTLDRDGFRFVHHDTEVRDFFDEAEVRSTYYGKQGRGGQEHECETIHGFMIAAADDPRPRGAANRHACGNRAPAASFGRGSSGVSEKCAVTGRGAGVC